MLPEKVQLVGLLRVVFEKGKGERLSISEERACVCALACASVPVRLLCVSMEVSA